MPSSHPAQHAPSTARAALASLLAATLSLGVLSPAAAEDASEASGSSAPPRIQLAGSSLPPGNSSTFTSESVLRGNASGDPDDFGPWVDDQREMYWDFELKDARMLRSSTECEQAVVEARDRFPGVESPREGVDICWSAFGVPAIFAEEAEDLWFGSGWAAAKLRLFLIEATARTARGTMAEAFGEGYLADDVQRRVTRYSDAEYAGMYEAMSDEAKVAVDSYVEGVNAYIAWVTTAGRDQLPAEFAALSMEPTPLTAIDVLAIGVEMVRFVASEGRRELRNVAALRALEDAHGRDLGRELFLQLAWQEDAEATVTLRRDEGVFPRTTATPAEREAAFHAMADWAATIPMELAEGPGVDGNVVDAEQPLAPSERAAGPSVIEGAGADVEKMFELFTGSGDHSYMVMLAPSMTADDAALLMSEPQLDFDPQLLMEIQLTGAGYDAKGATVAGIPVVGIGYTPTVAWAATTGNAKTIDTYIETTRDGDDGIPEYLHDGVWKDMACRAETVRVRGTLGGVPAGPAKELAPGAETVEVCRTVHGPVVSRTADGTRAASWQWHVWGREIDTIEAVLAWNRARTLEDIEDGVRLATWNENIGAVDAWGNIGFWHPGIHLERHPGTDLRLPIPGTGEFDNGDPLPFEALPQVVNPERGWIANWNNKPAHGWLDGGAEGSTSYPAGIDSRGATLEDIIAERDDWTFRDLIDLDREAAERDFRARHLHPMLLDLLGAATDLTATESAALDVLRSWDGSATGDDAGMEHPGYTTDAVTTVGAGPTIFDAMAEVLVDELLAVYDVAAYDFPLAQSYMGRHDYDTDPNLHLVLRVLDPSLSSITSSHDFTGGRSAAAVVRTVFADVVAQLEAEQGDDPTTWRSRHFDDERAIAGGKDAKVCSAVGSPVGPCGRMPWIERGAYLHHIGFVSPPEVLSVSLERDRVAAADDPDDGPLPATGGGLALTGLLAIAVSLGLRRRTM